MPELAEVEANRRSWDPGLGGRILEVGLHPRARDFRTTPSAPLRRLLPGSVLVDSAARGKQLLFRFSPDAGPRKGSGFLWLGIHLGMSGGLRVEEAALAQKAAESRQWGMHAAWKRSREKGGDNRHDHLVLRQHERLLIFRDPRQFGRVLFAVGEEAPAWWSSLPPSLLSGEFTLAAVATFLRRHARAPVKAVLLRQERFPGIGNWMADEILYRARVHPGRPAGGLSEREGREIWRQTRLVARIAWQRIGRKDLDPPRSWLFHQRWADGGRCPQTGALLVRETIGGRTTCWSPGVQKLGRAVRGAPAGLRRGADGHNPVDTPADESG